MLDAPDALMPWSPTSFFAMRDANAEQLRTLDTFPNMGKAHDVRDLLAAQDTRRRHAVGEHDRGRPDGNVLYADHSVVPNVPDDLVQTVQHPDRRGARAARRPARRSTAPARSSDCAWRTDADAERPGHLRPDEPARGASAATG